MDAPMADCNELTEKTAAVINVDVLRHLFVIVQRNNLKTCIEYCIDSLFEKQIGA